MLDQLLAKSLPAAKQQPVSAVQIAAISSGGNKTVLAGKLLLLLSAAGVGIGTVATIVGVSEEDLVKILAFIEDEKKALARHYATQLNKPMEEKLKMGATMAIDRLLAMLANPESTDKEVLVAGRDLLDRQLGKAVQRSEILNANLNVDANEFQLHKDIEASNRRIAELKAEREKIQLAYSEKGPSIDV